MVFRSLARSFPAVAELDTQAASSVDQVLSETVVEGNAVQVHVINADDEVVVAGARNVELRNLKPGAYNIELSVVDGRGRERKTQRRMQLKAR